MLKFLFLFLLGTGVFSLSSLAATASGEKKIKVFVGIPPAKYLVERIGGQQVEVQVMISPGKEVHDYEPTPRQIMALSAAPIYFSLDLPFEKILLAKIRGMNLKTEIADIAAGITRAPMAEHLVSGESDHHHDGACSHRHEPDPHIWLAPPLLKIMAENICAALSRTAPGQRALFRKNLEELRREIDLTDEEIKQDLAPFRGGTVYVFHPAFGYFLHHYGLRQEAVEIEGKSPAPRQIENLIKQARANKVRIIFVQPQFDPKSAAAVAAAIGGTVAVLDPLEENLPANLRKIAAELVKALRQQGL